MKNLKRKLKSIQKKKEYDEPLKRAFTYKALNRLIQGSAADMTKKAMVLLYEKGIVPHIQIHDELCVSSKTKKHGPRSKKQWRLQYL